VSHGYGPNLDQGHPGQNGSFTQLLSAPSVSCTCTAQHGCWCWWLKASAEAVQPEKRAVHWSVLKKSYLHLRHHLAQQTAVLSSAGSKMSHITVCKNAQFLEHFYWIFEFVFIGDSTIVMFYKSFNKTNLLVLSISLIKTPIRCSHSNKKNLRKHPFLRSSFKWWPPNKRCSLSPAPYIPCQLSFATVFWGISYVWCKIYLNLFNQCYYLLYSSYLFGDRSKWNFKNCA